MVVKKECLIRRRFDRLRRAKFAIKLRISSSRGDRLFTIRPCSAEFLDEELVGNYLDKVNADNMHHWFCRGLLEKYNVDRLLFAEKLCERAADKAVCGAIENYEQRGIEEYRFYYDDWIRSKNSEVLSAIGIDCWEDFEVLVFKELGQEGVDVIVGDGLQKIIEDRLLIETNNTDFLIGVVRDFVSQD